MIAPLLRISIVFNVFKRASPLPEKQEYSARMTDFCQSTFSESTREPLITLSNRYDPGIIDEEQTVDLSVELAAVQFRLDI
jgi:hypothetical protein